LLDTAYLTGLSHSYECSLAPNILRSRRLLTVLAVEMTYAALGGYGPRPSHLRTAPKTVANMIVDQAAS